MNKNKNKNKNKKKNKKRILVVLAVILLFILIGAAAVYHTIETNLEGLAAAGIKNVDLAAVPDGTYTGECRALPIEVRVSVTVKNHTITAIDLLEHNNGKGQAAESIPSKVVEAQSLQVDTVTGATYSSKAILKAIEDALVQ